MATQTQSKTGEAQTVNWTIFVQTLQAVTSCPSLDHIKELTYRNHELTETRDKLERREYANIEQLTEARAKLKEANIQAEKKQSEVDEMKTSLSNIQQKAKAEKDASAQKQTQMATEIEILKKLGQEREKRMEGLKQDHRKLVEDKQKADKMLKESSARLENYDGWLAKVQNIEPAKIAKELDNLFLRAHGFVRQYFMDDLEAEQYKNDNYWCTLRRHPRVLHPRHIFLPSKNTPQAKETLAAAVIAVLGHHFAETTFQPLYLLQYGRELSSLLSDLAHKDLPREAFVRTALLGIMDQEKQEQEIQARAKMTMDEILEESGIDKLVRPDKSKAFRTDLLELCVVCAKMWATVQRLSYKVEWFMPKIEDTENDNDGDDDDDDDDDDDYDNDDYDDDLADEDVELWDLLNPQAGSTSPKANGQASATSQQSSTARLTNGNTNKTIDLNHGPRAPRLATEDTPYVIWPCFYVCIGRGCRLLLRGVALEEAQVRLTYSEVQTLRRSSNSKHRDKRKKGRKSALDGAGKRRKFFLPLGGPGRLGTS